MPKKSKGAPSAARLKQVAALIVDCDGVLTNGDLVYDDQGRRTLSFYVRDGLGLALLCKVAKMPVAVLSGRPVDVVEHRHREVGIAQFVGNCRDKAAGVRELCEKLGVSPAHAAFIGDDLPDLPGMRASGLAIAVGDAAPEAKAVAHWVTRAPGGRGAVREVCEAILKARGIWSQIAG
jgi:3-deoxy-D-manno-octulosonate 8-phosphate phosphatase (KDO 8-P phosphatase)